MIKRPFLISALVISLAFVYLLLTEVRDRYAGTWNSYCSYQEKKTTVLDPVTLNLRREALTKKLDSLSSDILIQRNGYQQNEVGVIQCVSDNACNNQVSLESFNPGKEEMAGEFEEFSFEALVAGNFGKIGLMTNSIENASIPIDITKIQIVSDPISGGNLQLNLQAKAYLYHGNR